MNKRQIIASLNKISNQLDSTGLHKEANSLTNVMKRLVVADEFNILNESNETLEPTLNEPNTNPEKEKYMANVLDRKIYTRSLRQGLEDLGEQITVKQYLDIYAGSVKGQIDQLTRPDRYDPSKDVQKDFDYYLKGTMNNIEKKLSFLDIPTEPVLDYFKLKISPLQKYLTDKINQLGDKKNNL
jgi:hypothetical protein